MVPRDGLRELLAAPAALIVPIGAYWLAHYLADRQRRMFDAQLPDNLSVVASAMRAGADFLGALQAVVDSAPLTPRSVSFAERSPTPSSACRSTRLWARSVSG